MLAFRKCRSQCITIQRLLAHVSTEGRLCERAGNPGEAEEAERSDLDDGEAGKQDHRHARHVRGAQGAGAAHDGRGPFLRPPVLRPAA